MMRRVAPPGTAAGNRHQSDAHAGAQRCRLPSALFLCGERANSWAQRAAPPSCAERAQFEGDQGQILNRS